MESERAPQYVWVALFFWETSMIDDAFWLRYLRAHTAVQTRTIHLCGTIAASSALLAAAIFREPRLVLVALVVGYGPAWYAHARIEHNRPETFSRPFSSLFADYRMAALMLSGKIDAEVRRANGAA